MPGTARGMCLADPCDPDQAIDAQAHLMRDLLRRLGAVPLALAAYNAGPAPVAACGCGPPFSETRGYVARILELMNGAGEPVAGGAGLIVGLGAVTRTTIGCVLIGREAERSALRELVDAAREGRGGALLIRGEPGVGKTALLRYAESHAPDLRVARAVGVEAESEIAFAAVDQAVRAFGRSPARLSPQLSDALDARAPLQVTTAQRFAVGLALLEFLAVAAEEQAILLLVDDAQWIDEPSRDALHFVGRRLATEPLALLVATRDPPTGQRLGFPELTLEGLGASDALSLIASANPSVPRQVARRLVETTGGNPLALEEALRSLSDGQLTGADPLPPLLPAGEAIALAYRGRLEQMSAESRGALLVAAANDTDDPAVLAAALASVHLGLPALEEGIAVGLLQLGDGVEFPHPLARSAIYDAATRGERRSAHLALAEAFADAAHSDRRAWHRALAAAGPDEEIAGALEESANQALRRGGLGAAATTLERAAALTPGVDARCRRLAAAADAARRSGRIDQAVALVEQGLRLSDDPHLRARLQEIHGDAEYSRIPAIAASAYLAAADVLETLDRGRAVLMIANAVGCVGPTGNYRAALRMVDRAVALHERTSDASALGLAIAHAYSGRSADTVEAVAARTLDQWVEAFAEEPILLIELAYAHVVAERFDDADMILDRVIAQARAATALGVLSYALQTASWSASGTGRWLDVRALCTEAAALGEEIGVVIDVVWADANLSFVAAAQGREAEVRSLAERIDAASATLACPGLATVTRTVRGILALGLGDVDGAIAAFEAIRQSAREQGHNDQSWSRWHPNLVEAYVRAGRRDEAETLLAGVTEWRPADALTWGAACDARCRGLLAEEFEAPFEYALELHVRAGNPFERARTQLCYGERLRRARRRADARRHLREAHVAFERLRAEPWSRRAVAELEATGIAPEPVAPPALAELTPHELRVAGIVASGATNQEIASRLFVTPKTVEYHLRSIYRKMSIRSRSELTRLYLAEQALGAAA
jgi:DNA-binding CsgD family transcriptional regulator